MTYFNLYRNLLGVYIKNSIGNLGNYFGKNNDKILTEENRKKRTKKLLGGILVAVLALLVIISLVGYTTMMTVAAIGAGAQVTLLYALLFAVQLVLFVFGVASIINNLYFCRDNQLVSTMPIPTGIVFSVRFTMAYLGELLICAIMSLPMLITYGITCWAMGVHLGAEFYIISVISAFLLPIVPLLATTLISIPLMFLFSFIKSRTLAKTLVSMAMGLFIAAIYIAFSFMTGSLDQGDDVTVMNSQLVGVFSKIASFSAWNYNLIQAMLGVKSFVNFLICLAGLIGIFMIAVLLSTLFYRRGMSITMEESASSRNSKRKVQAKDFVNKGFRKSLILKEIKTILGTPQLFINNILGVVMLPLFLVIFLRTGVFTFTEESVGMASDLGAIGFICYFAAIMLASGNAISLVGFSLEGRNVQILKSLPISPREILISKLVTANLTNLIISLIVGVTYVIASSYHNVIVGLLLIITLFSNGMASSGIGLNSDMRNPNFKFNNINQLLKNNKRTFKPMLINLALGFVYFIMGILLSTFSSVFLSEVAAFAIFFAVALMVNFVFGFVTIKKLFDTVEEVFPQMEV